jgi:hypothetical protein
VVPHEVRTAVSRHRVSSRQKLDGFAGIIMVINKFYLQDQQKTFSSRKNKIIELRFVKAQRQSKTV